MGISVGSRIAAPGTSSNSTNSARSIHGFIDERYAFLGLHAREALNDLLGQGIEFLIQLADSFEEIHVNDRCYRLSGLGDEDLVLIVRRFGSNLARQTLG